MNKLIAFAEKQNTEVLVTAVEMIGGGWAGIVGEDKAAARAAMIQVIENRMGEAFADALMNRIGM